MVICSFTSGLQVCQRPVEPRDLPADSGALQEDLDLCPPLEPSTGDTVTVSTEADLQNAVNNAASSGAILVAAGTYDLQMARLWRR